MKSSSASFEFIIIFLNETCYSSIRRLEKKKFNWSFPLFCIIPAFSSFNMYGLIAFPPHAHISLLQSV